MKTHSRSSALISVVLLLTLTLTGCQDTSEKNAPAKLPTLSTESSKSPDNSESSIPQSESTGSEPEASAAESSVSEPPITAPIRIDSLSEALSRFDELVELQPTSDDPEEIVRTLLNKNVACFAAMQGKCWTSPAERGEVRIESEYIKNHKQLADLFYGTYTEDQSWRLFHPQEVGGYADLFRDAGGGVYFDMQHLRKFHGDSFSTVTFAAVVEANEDEIIFERAYQNNPTEKSKRPNATPLKAIRENDEWRLEVYITDAPGFDHDAPEYAKLKETGRKGSPELIEFAKREVGNIGGAKYWGWYGFDKHIEWCAAFVSWSYYEAGKNGPYFLSCNSEGKAWFQYHGKWVWRGYEDIAPGDSIFFDWDGDGSADHVGLVLGTDGENVYTIEGNRDDVCVTLSYPADYPKILGYGLMSWE